MDTLKDYFLIDNIRDQAKMAAGHYDSECLKKRMYPFLEPEMEIAYRWKQRQFGSFFIGFMDNIHRADGGNLYNLYKAFPVEVAAIKIFYTVNGWYPHVEKLVKEFKDNERS